MTTENKQALKKIIKASTDSELKTIVKAVQRELDNRTEKIRASIDDEAVKRAVETKIPRNF